MTKQQIIEKLAKHGIHQLRKGETAADALRYVDGEIPFRVGYQVKTDSGRPMTKNEVIVASNKEAFSKMFTRPTYVESELIGMDISEIPDHILKEIEDCRDDTDKIGVLEPCEYCGAPIRTDYEGQWNILNCEDRACMAAAIWDNCM